MSKTKTGRTAKKYLPRTTIKLFWILWLIALCTPAYLGTKLSELVPGILCFMFGVFGLTTYLPAGIAWLANIPAFVGIRRISKGKYVSAVNAGILAVLLSVASLFVRKGLPTDISDNMPTVILGPGVFLWIASMMVVPVGACLALSKGKGFRKGLSIYTSSLGNYYRADPPSDKWQK